jgi:hypothetical protein
LPPIQPPRVVPVDIPTPEQLGMTTAPPTAAPGTSANVDWCATQSRLQELGAVGFSLERVAKGCRFSCLLPCAGRRERVEAEADNEAEAVRLCLERAGRWKSQKR